jgi:hypothetical protein
MGKDLEYYAYEIEDLRNQREYLLDKVVIGQRLALARCGFSFYYAKLKIWTKLSTENVAGMRAYFDAALKGAIGAIGSTKDRMMQLE